MKLLNEENGFGNIIYGAVGLVILIIMIGTIIMPAIFGTSTAATMTCGTYSNTSCNNGWSVAHIAMWGILPLVVIASAIMFVIGKK